MTRSIAFFFLGCIATTSLVVACGDEETSPISTTTAGPTSGQGGGLGGADFGVGGSGGSGAGQNVGGEGQATPVWNFEHGGAASMFAKAAAADSDGNIVVVGSFSGAPGELGGTPITNAGGDDVFIAKYDGQGAHLWSKSFGDGGDEGALAVAVDSQGSIWLAGTFKGAINFGGPNLQASDNQFPDAFVAKLDASGNHIFSAKYGVGAGTTDVVNALAVDSTGNVVMAGMFQSSISFGGTTLTASGGAGDFDVFVAKLDASGGHLFSRAFGFGERQEALAVAVGPADVIAVGGYTSGDIDFGGEPLTHPGSGERAFAAVLDASGNRLFAKLYEGDDSARTTAVTIGDDGDVFVAGNFKTSIDLGEGALESPSNNDDIFVARHEGSGGLVYGVHFGGNGAEKASAIAVDGGGLAAVAGWFKGEVEVNGSTTLTATATNNDAFVLRLGNPGHGFWGLQLHAVENAQARAITLAGGDVVIAGDFSGELDFGDGPVGTGAQQDLFLARFAP